MAMDDQEFREYVAASLAKLTTQVESINGRLFGNGQPGVLQYLSNETKRIETESRERDTNISDDLEPIKKKLWYASGAGAVIGAILSAIVEWFTYHK